MSAIKQLLETFCPNGVPQMRIDQVCKRFSGLPLTAGQMRDMHDPAGDVRIFAGGHTIADVRAESINGKFLTGPGLIVKSRGHIDFEYWTGRYSHKNEFWSYKPISDQLNLKYLFYLLKTRVLEVQAIAKANSVKMPQIKVGDIDGMQIPVPPIEVQIGIVKILDTFEELDTELAKELMARKSQYEYIRELLLSPSYLEQFELESTTLGKVGRFMRGRGIQKVDLLPEGLPAIHYGQIHAYFGTSATKTKSFVTQALWHKSARAKPGDLLIATTSESVEDVCKATAWLGDTEVALSADAMYYTHELDPLFITYFFQSHHFGVHKARISTGTKVKRISAAKMSEIPISLPPTDIQRKIGRALNELELLITSLEEGLPAEIRERRRQYEHYRSRLLTFKELDTE